MKKTALALTLTVCLALLILAFASCGKNKTADTTPVPSGACAHTWGDYVIDLPPTCSEPGVKSKYCSKCGAQNPDSIAAIDPVPHTEAEEYTIDTPANCRRVGYRSKHCSVCGEIIGSTVEELSIDENVHDVENWEVTSAATLLNPIGSRHGVCSLCNNPVNEVLQFKHDVQVFTTAAGKYTPGYATLGEIRGDKHFYDAGNDLLIEYSILWNDTLLNLFNSEGALPAIDARFTLDKTGTRENKGIVRLELTNDCPSQWCTCKFAGGLTVTGTPESDHPYPRFGTTVADVTAYPNVGGANPGDGIDQGEPQWGWHRIQIRVREEIANAEAVKTGSDATYYIQIWVYIDGALVSHTSTANIKKTNPYDRQFYTAASDDKGGIAYVENDNLYLHGAFLDSKRMKDGTGYFEIADYSATIGNEFVQKVVKVSNPEPATLTVAEGVELPASMYYKLAD